MQVAWTRFILLMRTKLLITFKFLLIRNVKIIILWYDNKILYLIKSKYCKPCRIPIQYQLKVVEINTWYVQTISSVNVYVCYDQRLNISQFKIQPVYFILSNYYMV